MADSTRSMSGMSAETPEPETSGSGGGSPAPVQHLLDTAAASGVPGGDETSTPQAPELGTWLGDRSPTPVVEQEPQQVTGGPDATSSNPPSDTPSRRRRARAANAAADEQADGIEDRVGDRPGERGDDSALPDEREEWFRAPGLQRMKMTFSRDDQQVLRQVEEAVQSRIDRLFMDAYIIMSDLYDVVREPEEVLNPSTGELQPRIGDNGFVVWRKNPATGAYIEHWDRLTSTQREEFLFRITTQIFDWEQRKERLWTEAMFAKAIFTERFSIEYDAPMTGTIDDRNAVGNAKAAEDRYFALMVTSMSRRADAIVRSMNTLMLRLRDTLQ